MLFFQNLNPYTSVAISDFVLLIYNDNNTEQLCIKLYGFLVGIHTIVTMVCYGMCLSLIYVLDIANSLYFNNIPYI